MSDRAPIEVTVYRCPEEARGEAFDAVAEYAYEVEWGTGEFGSALQLGVAYTGDEVHLGAVEEIGDKLAALGCTFEAAQEAKYEYDGWVILHDPEAGTWSGAGSADGAEPILRASEIDALVEETSGRADLVAKLDARTGHTVREVIKAERERTIEQVQA